MVFVCVLGMLLCLAWSVARAEPFDYDPSHTPSDGLLHVAAGAGIAASISIYTQEIRPDYSLDRISLSALGFCAAAGLGKELGDEVLAPGGFSEWDLAATVGGCGVGVMIGGVYMVATKGLDGDDDYGVMVAVRF